MDIKIGYKTGSLKIASINTVKGNYDYEKFANQSNQYKRVSEICSDRDIFSLYFGRINEISIELD
jgi:hypothetical protein